MSSILHTGINRFTKRINAIKKIDELIKNKNILLAIHYSCESFYENQSGSNKITSIAVKDISSGQTKSFSIHKYAEELKIEKENVLNEYSKIEKKLLADFFLYVQTKSNCYWIHWNMRNENFGFYALEHRFKILGGKPYQIPDNFKFDLSRSLVELLGDNYINHPRLENILEFNNCTMKDFLNGEQESNAFKEFDFSKLHLSTLRKVGNISTLLDLASSNKIKSKNTWFEKYGFTPELIGNYLSQHYAISIISTILTIYGLFELIKKLYIHFAN